VFFFCFNFAKKEARGAFATGFSLNRFYCMKLQFDLPNVCQKEKISLMREKKSHLTDFLPSLRVKTQKTLLNIAT